MRSDLEILTLHEAAALQALIKLRPARDGYRVVSPIDLAAAVGTSSENAVVILQKFERLDLIRRAGSAGRGKHLVQLGPEAP